MNVEFLLLFLPLIRYTVGMLVAGLKGNQHRINPSRFRNQVMQALGMGLDMLRIQAGRPRLNTLAFSGQQ